MAVVVVMAIVVVLVHIVAEDQVVSIVVLQLLSQATVMTENTLNAT